MVTWVGERGKGKSLELCPVHRHVRTRCCDLKTVPSKQVYMHGNLKDVPFSREALERSFKHLPMRA